MRTRADLFKELEVIGEKSVRMAFVNGDYKGSSGDAVREWLESKRESRARRNDLLAKVIAISAIAIPILIEWLMRK